jgi:hypothetical protein
MSNRREVQMAYAEAEARAWNDAHEDGTYVELTIDSGEKRGSRTRSPAWVLDCGIAVVLLCGVSGGYRLSRLRAISEEEASRLPFINPKPAPAAS